METKMSNKEILEEKLNRLETEIQELNNELSTTQHELKVIGKPIMSQKIYELIQDTIRNAIDDLSFSSDDFVVELCIDYDNRVELNTIEFENHESMFDDIISRIDKDFRVIDGV